MILCYNEIPNVITLFEQKLLELKIITEPLNDDIKKYIEEALSEYCLHQIAIAVYGMKNVSIESLSTNEVIIDSDLLELL